MDNDANNSDRAREIESGFRDISPNISGNQSNHDVESDNSEPVKKEGAAKKALNAAESAASLVATRGRKGSAGASKTGGGLFSGSGKQAQPQAKKGGKGFGKIAIALPGIAIIGIGVLIIGVIGTPMLLLGGIDMNLQDSLGFLDTVALLEKQGEYVTAEQLANGEVPDGYAKDLVAHGIEVGQVTLGGDFVQTNIFIADLGQPKEVAGIGEYYNNVTGALSVRFNNEVISADNFVAVVESNPIMYAAYSEAADISARYYYSDDVTKVFREEMNVSRNNFASWKDTGNSLENQKQLSDIVAKAINKKTDVGVAGYLNGDDGSEAAEAKVSGDAGGIVSNVSSSITGDNATKKAAQLLNTAVSSSEPYKAASAFVVIEDGIQKTRIQDNGPANEIMNMLNEKTEVTYQDVATGEYKTTKQSILETQNFAATVGGGGYSDGEATNFSRDRILLTTNTADGAIIEDTSVASEGQKSSKSILEIGWGASADPETIGKAENAVSLAITKDNSELLTSVVGGNRIPEGGSFLSNTINQRVLGSVPSDAETVANYHREVDEIIARKAEADRATRSPFDFTSPNTFLGSIINNGIKSAVKNQAVVSNKTSITSTIGTIADLTGRSAKNMFGQALADGNDGRFTLTSGNCPTSKLISNVECDLYGTSHTTNPTDYMAMTRNDWINSGIGLDSSGKVENGTGLAEFSVVGQDRPVTVGVRSADMCEEYKKIHGIGDSIGSLLAKFLNIYESCSDVDESVANGTKYTLSDKNGDKDTVEKYSAFVLYDTVSSLLAEKQSSVSLFKEQYYAAHPKDESPVGRLSRVSGLTKEEAHIALDYQSYLIALANYDPVARYAFGKPLVEIEKKLDFSADAKKANDGVMLLGIAYRDERNRSFAV